MKKFDLNIKNILENWPIHFGIREIIANAIDENIITNTNNIEIYKSKELKDVWHIKDFGRGLREEHLIQDENQEKIANDSLIGQFGIGLKDALATINRAGMKVKIISKYINVIGLETSPKINFEDLITLHVVMDETNIDENFVGTEFIIEGIKDEDIENAKKLFLIFGNVNVLDKTQFGEILEKQGESASIYLNGVKVGEEDNFLFSYNITSLDSKIRKGLNRERTNLGRNSYTDRIKKILLKTENINVLNMLNDEICNESYGGTTDEIKWLDIKQHALKFGSSENVYLTVNQIMDNPILREVAENLGKKVIIVQENFLDKLNEIVDSSETNIFNFESLIQENKKNFKYDFVTFEQLTENEKKVFVEKENIIEIFGGRPKRVKEILISNTMEEISYYGETLGLWDIENSRIIIKREQLKSIDKFAGTLIHELIHAKTGFGDVERKFENALTSFIGLIVKKII